MDLFPQLQQLQDLPNTFKRPNAPFVELMYSIAAGLTLLTEATTNLESQTDFTEAANGWNDVWGGLPGIVRRTGESDDNYHQRLSTMLQAWRDSTVAIQTWLEEVENVESSVYENSPGIGYNVLLPPGLSLTQFQQILTNLAYVRPAGVPFDWTKRLGATFLSTVNYYGQGYKEGPWSFGARVTGAYLTGSSLTAGVRPPASTNNQQSTLPDLLLSPLFAALTDALLYPPKAPSLAEGSTPGGSISVGIFVLDQSLLGGPDVLVP